MKFGSSLDPDECHLRSREGPADVVLELRAQSPGPECVMVRMVVEKFKRMDSRFGINICTTIYKLDNQQGFTI